MLAPCCYNGLFLNFTSNFLIKVSWSNCGQRLKPEYWVFVCVCVCLFMYVCVCLRVHVTDSCTTLACIWISQWVLLKCWDVSKAIFESNIVSVWTRGEANQSSTMAVVNSFLSLSFLLSSLNCKGISFWLGSTYFDESQAAVRRYSVGNKTSSIKLAYTLQLCSNWTARTDC